MSVQSIVAIAVAVVIVIVGFYWVLKLAFGAHLGLLPKNRDYRAYCRGSQHLYPLAISYKNSHWSVNLWLIQFGGPHCDRCV